MIQTSGDGKYSPFAVSTFQETPNNSTCGTDLIRTHLMKFGLTIKTNTIECDKNHTFTEHDTQMYAAPP